MLLRMAGIVAAFAAVCGCVSKVPNCNGCARDGELHVNDIVTVGTHNSYKQAIDP